MVCLWFRICRHTYHCDCCSHPCFLDFIYLVRMHFCFVIANLMMQCSYCAEILKNWWLHVFYAYCTQFWTLPLCNCHFSLIVWMTLLNILSYLQWPSFLYLLKLTLSHKLFAAYNLSALKSKAHQFRTNASQVSSVILWLASFQPCGPDPSHYSLSDEWIRVDVSLVTHTLIVLFNFTVINVWY